MQLILNPSSACKTSLHKVFFVMASFLLMQCEQQNKTPEPEADIYTVQQKTIVLDGNVKDTSSTRALRRMNQFFNLTKPLVGGWFEQEEGLFIETSLKNAFNNYSDSNEDTSKMVSNFKKLEHRLGDSDYTSFFITHVLFLKNYENGNFYSIVRKHDFPEGIASIYYNRKRKKFYQANDLGQFNWAESYINPSYYANSSVYHFATHAYDFFLYFLEFDSANGVPPGDYLLFSVNLHAISKDGRFLKFDAIEYALLALYAKRTGKKYEELIDQGKNCEKILADIGYVTKIVVDPQSQKILLKFPIYKDTVQYYLDEEKMQFIKMESK